VSSFQAMFDVSDRNTIARRIRSSRRRRRVEIGLMSRMVRRAKTLCIKGVMLERVLHSVANERPGNGL